jgi:hypothetical protein
MRVRTIAIVVSVCLSGIIAAAQTQTAPSGATDIYHVHFTKAAPGQADALGKVLMKPDTSSPMPDHFVVLRHQEGDDWDYAVIQHLGPKAVVDAGAPAPPAAERDLRSWHDDTFVVGPSWAEFTRQMGIGGSGKPGAVYTVGVHRTVPGHREQLEKALSQAPPSDAKIQTGNLLLAHVEGGDWTFLTITRYDSWQDFAADRAAPAAGPGGWGDIRQHSAFHRDTIADRIFPQK